MQTFTRAELEVMQVLWRHGSLKPGDIQKQFDRPVKNATLRSVLRVLLEKGHVNRTAVGKAFAYQAVSGSRSWVFPSADSDYDVRFLKRLVSTQLLDKHKKTTRRSIRPTVIAMSASSARGSNPQGTRMTLAWGIASS